MNSITSRDNPRFQELLKLAEQPRVRRRTGQTWLDGEHLLAEALHAGIRPRCLVLRESAAGEAAWLERLPGVPVLSLSATLFQALSPVASPVGVAAVIDIPLPRSDTGQDAILLEDVQDPGNLGAMLRSAAAAGFARAYLSKGCAEAWSPKALRGGQGAQFRLAIHEHADLATVIAGFPGPVYAATLRTSRSLYELDLGSPLAFLFGNEGAGLSAEARRLAQSYAIPMPGGVESLNVAAAAAVSLFECVRQRGQVR